MPFGFYLLVNPKDNSKNYVTNTPLTENMKDFQFFEFKDDNSINMKNTDIGKIQKYVATYVVNDFKRKYNSDKSKMIFGYLSMNNKSKYVLKLVTNKHKNGRIIGKTTSVKKEEMKELIRIINDKYLWPEICNRDTEGGLSIDDFSKYLEMILKENNKFIRFDLHYFLYLQI